jgi:AmiR/NasT family two-component response regulator
MSAMHDLADLHGCKVMVVEDEPLEALDYCDRLSEAGAEIVGPFDSASEALHVVDTLPVDVALLDYALADSNSEELQAAL